MYDINDKTESTFVSFTPGIQENVLLDAVKFEPADKEGLKDKVLRFVFRGPAGEVHTETIFPINKENTIKAAQSWNRNPNDVLKEESLALTGKVMHIMTTFIPKEQAFLTASSWEDFCGQVITKLGASYKNVPVRLKIVLNSKDYMQLPKKAKAPFIQKMAEANKLVINPKYDNIVYKMKAAVIADPFASPTSNSEPLTIAAKSDPFAF
jgi:hypothetical protein